MNADLDDLERRIVAVEREWHLLPPDKREETRRELREIRAGIELLRRSPSTFN